MTKKAKELASRYRISEEGLENFEPLFHENGFNHKSRPVILDQDPIRFNNYSWGLIPFWTKNLEQAYTLRNSCLNAVSETAFDKPSFKASIRRKRCIVPSTGFFEWKEIAKGKKQPYFIRVKSTDIFSMAGIYQEWVDGDDKTIYKTFSVLTCPANPLMEEIHNTKKRMPLILPQKLEREWLDESLNQEQIKSFFLPYPDEDMEAWTISNLISSRKENSNVPEVLKKQ